MLSFVKTLALYKLFTYLLNEIASLQGTHVNRPKSISFKRFCTNWDDISLHPLSC